MLNTLKVDYFEKQFNQVVDLSEIRINDSPYSFVMLNLFQHLKNLAKEDSDPERFRDRMKVLLTLRKAS